MTNCVNNLLVPLLSLMSIRNTSGGCVGSGEVYIYPGGTK